MSSILDPAWNRPVVESDRALDPLGMNRVNNRMIADLMLGFTTVTSRARYYSFYTWAINQIRKKKLAKEFAEFKTALNDLERLFMLSCVAHETTEPHNNHSNMAGVNQGRKAWRENSKISLDFRYLRSSWGGYYEYQRSLRELGLVEIVEDGYEQLTELGHKVNKYFDTLAIQSGILLYYKKQLITRQKLTQMGKKICLCRLKEQGAEKKILKEIFFGFVGFNNEYSKLRRESFILFLTIIDQAAKQKPCINAQDFLDAVYFGEIGTATNPIRITKPTLLANTSQRWKIVKAHDNLSLAAESILQSFLGLLRSNRAGGVQSEEFFQRVLDGFNNKFENLLNKSGENFVDRSIRKVISITLANNVHYDDYNAILQASKKFDKTVALSYKLSEKAFITNLEKLTQEKAPDLGEVVANGIMLVLLTALRLLWQVNSNEISAEWLKRLEGRDVGVFKLVDFVEDAIRYNKTMHAFTREFIDEYVLSQAELVYKDKLLSSTNPRRWFHKEGSSYVRDRDYDARHREIRFSSAMSLLHDLDLVNKSENLLECTAAGKEMLNRVLSA